MSFHTEQLSPRVWKTVQEDPYGQFPFLYAIMCADKCVLVDTGCACRPGASDYRAHVSNTINKVSFCGTLSALSYG